MRSEQRREKERSPGRGGGGRGRESVWFPHYPGRFAATAFCVLVGPVAFIPLIALQHSCPASPPSPPPAARPRPSEGEVTKHEEDQLGTARGTLFADSGNDGDAQAGDRCRGRPRGRQRRDAQHPYIERPGKQLETAPATRTAGGLWPSWAGEAQAPGTVTSRRRSVHVGLHCPVFCRKHRRAK